MLRVRQDGDGLLPGHAGKPLEKVIEGRTFLEILEQRSHWHASSLEDSGAANVVRLTFNRGASAPVQHDARVDLFTAEQQAVNREGSKDRSAPE